MLPLPDSHWSKTEVLAAWIELSVLGHPDTFATRGEVTGVLRDSQLFASVSGTAKDVDDPVSSCVEQLWTLIGLRSRSLGNASPFDVGDDTIQLRKDRPTDGVVAYASMLLIEAASLKWYAAIAIDDGDKIRTWFEDIAKSALANLSGGVVERFGAPFPSSWPPDFPARVETLASKFSLRSRGDDIKEFGSDKAQDASLDLVARWRVADERPAGLYVLVQCATGANWTSAKTGAPSLELWKKFVAWDGKIAKGIAVPFALADKELAKASFSHNEAIVFDRIRLAAGNPDATISRELREHLSRWCKAKFKAIEAPEQVTTPARREGKRSRRKERKDKRS